MNLHVETRALALIFLTLVACGIAEARGWIPRRAR